MVAITVKKYADAEVHTITEGNRELFWVKMMDVQDGLGVKNMSDLIRKDIQGIYETKDPTEEQKRKCIRSENKIDEKDPEASSEIIYLRSDRTEKIIKNCREVTKCNDGIKRIGKKRKRRTKRKF